jgi:hypothetical protein
MQTNFGADWPKLSTSEGPFRSLIGKGDAGPCSSLILDLDGARIILLPVNEPNDIFAPDVFRWSARHLYGISGFPKKLLGYRSVRQRAFIDRAIYFHRTFEVMHLLAEKCLCDPPFVFLNGGHRWIMFGVRRAEHAADRSGADFLRQCDALRIGGGQCNSGIIAAI